VYVYIVFIHVYLVFFFFFFQAEDGIRDLYVTGVQTCALPICRRHQSVNTDLVARYQAGGDGLVSSTRLRDRYAIRMCVMNHTSGERDVEQVLDWFADAATTGPAARRTAEPLAAGAVAARGPRANQPEVLPAEIEGVDLFA